MSENKCSIELLPEGKFMLTLKDGQKIRGRFSMYALNRFCVKKGINYFEAIAMITMAMTIEDYAELVLFGIEDYYRKDYNQCCFIKDEKPVRWTTEEVMDQVFENFGFGSEVLLGLFKHAIGRLTTVKEDAKSEEEYKALSEDDKKKEPNSGSDS